jgi:thiamine biosynthesis lipoprotein
MVNAGGNIYCLGKKYSRKWRIGIQHPRKSQEILFYLELENQAVATSGDYQQYFSSKGKRYSHIIDPKTGYPVDNGVISATIIALDGASSDALSTSVFVLGKEKGQELVKSLKGVEARIIEEKDI